MILTSCKRSHILRLKMSKVHWDLTHFNISIDSIYKDIDELGKDIKNLFGSDNFSEIDSLDWFLINKKKQISFLLLSIPSIIKNINNNNIINMEDLCSVHLSDCIDSFLFNISIQEHAFFSAQDNALMVTSDTSLLRYKTLIFDDLYFLLDDKLSYQGFYLNNAIAHIPSLTEPQRKNNRLFLEYIKRMFEFCTEEFYEAMDDEDGKCLQKLNILEKECLKNQISDERLIYIVEFIKNVKNTFYDME